MPIGGRHTGTPSGPDTPPRLAGIAASAPAIDGSVRHHLPIDFLTLYGEGEEFATAQRRYQWDPVGQNYALLVERAVVTDGGFVIVTSSEEPDSWSARSFRDGWAQDTSTSFILGARSYDPPIMVPGTHHLGVTWIGDAGAAFIAVIQARLCRVVDVPAHTML